MSRPTELQLVKNDNQSPGPLRYKPEKQIEIEKKGPLVRQVFGTSSFGNTERFT